jgi:MFS family permease
VHLQQVPLALRRLVPSAYRPVLANREFRRLLLGFAVSYLGDGMSFVAVPWLAIELAPQATAGLWVGGAVAAYTLPGVAGALVLGRRLRRVSARRLLLADNVVRGVALGAVPLAWLAGLLTLPLYVALLAVSSLLHAWAARAGTPCWPSCCPTTSGSPRTPSSARSSSPPRSPGPRSPVSS